MAKLSLDAIRQIYKKLCKKQKVSKLSRDLFCSLSGITKYQIAKYCGSFENVKDPLQACIAKEESQDEGLVPIYEYVDYNSLSQEYRFNFLNFKNIGKFITLPKHTVMAIIQAYAPTTGEPLSVKEIANLHKIPHWVVKAILRTMGITHDDIPLAKDDIDNKSIEENVENLLEVTRGEIHNRVQKQIWDNQVLDAQKWRQFEALRLNPYESFLKNWKPPKYSGPMLKAKAAKNQDAFIVTISDIHFGAKAHKDELYYTDDDWNLEMTKQAMQNYINSIEKQLLSMTSIPSECILLSLGDIIHTISGFTTKGTALEYDIKGPKLMEEAMNTLVNFITYLASKFNKLSIKAVSGNHDAFADWALFYTLQQYFRSNKNITWDISKERWLDFILGSNLFIMEHGYSAYYKSKVPKAASAREAYIQRLMIKTHKENIKNRYFFMGDRHHFNATSFPMFEFIQLPTCVGGDLYADHLNLAGTTTKQCTFVFDKDLGLTSITNHYI